MLLFLCTVRIITIIFEILELPLQRKFDKPAIVSVIDRNVNVKHRMNVYYLFHQMATFICVHHF